jgi:hypothetical protein
VRHAEIDTPAKRCDCTLAIPPVDVPGTLPDYRNRVAGAAELFPPQDFLATRPSAQTIMSFFVIASASETIHISA